MKHLKKFEQFDLVNEEISKKSIFTILSSLFLNLQGSSKSIDSKPIKMDKEISSDKQLSGDFEKIKDDLNKLSSSVNDTSLSSLIDKVNNIKDKVEIKPVCDQISSFISKNKIYDKEISDSLNHIKSMNLDLLKKDKDILLQKYIDLWDDHVPSVSKKSQTKPISGWYILIIVILIWNVINLTMSYFENRVYNYHEPSLADDDYDDENNINDNEIDPENVGVEL
jgi:hypothetical protein